MKKTTFFIAGKHAVTEALKNPNRNVLKVFLTEDSKKKLNKNNQKFGAGEGNRTLTTSLEGWCSTIELHPHLSKHHLTHCRKAPLNGGGGRIRTFEDRSQRVYSPPHLTALVPLRKLRGYRS